MRKQERHITLSGFLFATVILINVWVIYFAVMQSSSWYWWLIITIPLLYMSVKDVLHKKYY